MAHILYIEDDEDNAFMLELWLKKNNYEVTIATTAESGLEFVENKHPSLIIMDLSLPKMSGLDATKILKSQDKTKHIPIIILTTHAMLGDKEIALSSGANDYETKPVEFSNLLKKIKAHLKSE